MQLQPLSEDYFSSQVLKMNIQSEFWKSDRDDLQKKRDEYCNRRPIQIALRIATIQ